jgi:cytidine deaminase
MQEKEISIHIQIYDSAAELPKVDTDLIAEATKALDKSYSPYSGFKVASAALLQNGAVISGANQENASYPVCVCAEVVMLSACSAQHPGVAISKIAITTRSGKTGADSPKAPCGQCRQTLLEYENRFKSNIEVIMCGENGQVYKVGSVKELLPLYFSGADLK